VDGFLDSARLGPGMSALIITVTRVEMLMRRGDESSGILAKKTF